MATTNRKLSKHLAHHGAAEVRRTTFDGMPIVDAVAEMSILVRTQDVEAAKGSERDATNCILAKACASQTGASRVAFFRSVAYLDLPDENGQRRVVRYVLSKAAAAIVKAFDKGQKVRGEVMVTLSPPRPSAKLDYIRAKSKRLGVIKREKRKAIMRGEIIDDSATRSLPSRLFRKPADMDVRMGSGLVHNAIKKV